MRIKVELIQEFMKNHRISMHRLGMLSGLSRRTVVNVLTDSKNTTYYALEQVAKLMDVKVSDVVE